METTDSTFGSFEFEFNDRPDCFHTVPWKTLDSNLMMWLAKNPHQLLHTAIVKSIFSIMIIITIMLMMTWYVFNFGLFFNATESSYYLKVCAGAQLISLVILQPLLLISCCFIMIRFSLKTHIQKTAKQFMFQTYNEMDVGLKTIGRGLSKGQKNIGARPHYDPSPRWKLFSIGLIKKDIMKMRLDLLKTLKGTKTEDDSIGTLIASIILVLIIIVLVNIQVGGGRHQQLRFEQQSYIQKVMGVSTRRDQYPEFIRVAKEKEGSDVNIGEEMDRIYFAFTNHKKDVEKGQRLTNLVPLSITRTRQRRIKKNSDICDKSKHNEFLKFNQSCSGIHADPDILESSNFFRSWDVKLSYPVDITIDKFSHTPDDKGHYISSPQLSFTDDGGYDQIQKESVSFFKMIDDESGDNWIDSYTKTLVMEMTVYNPDIGLAHMMTIGFEFLPTGIYKGVTTFYSSFLDSKVTNESMLIAMTIFFALFLLQRAIMQCAEFERSGVRMWLNPVMVLFLCESVAGVFFILFLTTLYDARAEKLKELREARFEKRDLTTFVNFESLGRKDQFTTIIGAALVFINLLLICMRGRKIPLLRSAIEIVIQVPSVTVFPILGITSYAILGHLLFSRTVEFFHTIPKSFTGILSLIWNGIYYFDYIAVHHYQKLYGQIFFCTMVYTMNWILLNFLFMYIGDLYEQERTRSRNAFKRQQKKIKARLGDDLIHKKIFRHSTDKRKLSYNQIFLQRFFSR